MKFKVNGEEVFASTGGRPFNKNKPLIIGSMTEANLNGNWQ